MIIENNLKIEEYQNKINKINYNYEKKENTIENIARNSLVLYSVGALATPCTIITGHPHLTLIAASTAILSITAFSASLGVIVSTDKKIDRLKQKIKELEK